MRKVARGKRPRSALPSRRSRQQQMTARVARSSAVPDGKTSRSEKEIAVEFVNYKAKIVDKLDYDVLLPTRMKYVTAVGKPSE